MYNQTFITLINYDKDPLTDEAIYVLMDMLTMGIKSYLYLTEDEAYDSD